MINYLKGELYILVRRKATYVLPLFLYTAGIAFVWLLNNVSGPNTNEEIRRILSVRLQMTALAEITARLGPFAILMCSIVTYNNETANGTLKNTFSFGFSRMTVILGKYLIAALYSIIVAFSSLFVYALAIITFTKSNLSQLSLAPVNSVALQFIVLLGMLAYFVLCEFHLRNQNLAIGAYFGFSIFMQIALPVLSVLQPDLYRFFNDYYPENLMSSLIVAPSSNIVQAIICGSVLLVSGILLNYIGFKGKDIK